MLKGIPKALSPDILRILSEMGYGDELVIADGNFSTANIGKNCVRAPGIGSKEMLDAVLTVFPIDQFVKNPVQLMAIVSGTRDDNPIITSEYAEIFEKHYPCTTFDRIELEKFYEKAKNAYATIVTGETAYYASILIRKGYIY